MKAKLKVYRTDRERHSYSWSRRGHYHLTTPIWAKRSSIIFGVEFERAWRVKWGVPYRSKPPRSKVAV